MAIQKLDTAAIEKAVSGIPGWGVKNGKLHKDYVFPDFSHAVGFMTMAAVRIEKIDHHPEWCNVYNKVSVDLSTHDAGGITQRDVDLARLLDELAGKLK